MSEVPQDAWFYTREGERIGPLTFGDLKIRVSEGLVNPRTDFVWTVGMDAWKPAGEIEGLFERRVAEPANSQSMADTPDLDESGIPYEQDRWKGRQEEWPGFGRLLYFVLTILLGFVAGAAPALVAPFAKGYESFLIALPILTLLLMIWLGVKRLINLGMSGWWYLGNLVPFLNLWVSYRMTVCPPGYAFHRKLDGIGILLAIFYWLILLAAIAGTVAIVLVLMGSLGDPQLKQQILEEFNKAKASAPAR